jgi:hypothetical protein
MNIIKDFNVVDKLKLVLKYGAYILAAMEIVTFAIKTIEGTETIKKSQSNE